MAFDPVPFFVGGGAEHSAEVMRLMAWIATGGQEGVFGPLDLCVTQDSPPSGSVSILPGAGVMVSKYPSIVQQSYLFRGTTATLVPITATPAGTGRSDLVVARVLDPHVSTSGDANPASIANGPYIVPYVVPNVPNTTKSVHQVTPALGYTAITLARLDIPANTATITAAMIKNLRTTVNPAFGKAVPAPEAEGSDEGEVNLWKRTTPCVGGAVLGRYQTTYTNWPAEANWNIRIPKWCTEIEYFGVLPPRVTGSVWGAFRLTFDGVASSENTFDANVRNSPGPEDRTFVIGGKYTVPIAQRGKTVNVRLQGKMYNPASHDGTLVAHAGCYFRLELDFLGTPSTS